MKNPKFKSLRVVILAVLALAWCQGAWAAIDGSGTPNCIAKFTDTYSIGNSVIYESNGFIGIGTTSPASPLHIIGVEKIYGGETWVFNNGNSPRVLVGDSSDGGEYGYLKWDSANDQIRLGTNTGSDSVTVAESGNVGIGTTSPVSRLTVANGDLLLRDYDASTGGLLRFYNKSANSSFILKNNGASGQSDLIFRKDTTDVMAVKNNGNVGIGTSSPSQKLTVRGNIRIERASGQACLELGEGLDYAEGFHVSEKTKPSPGTVLVIDPDNPGKLTIGAKAYDTKVVGIVAGAQGIGSGVRLGVDTFDCDVALAGRVYCNVDATETAIEPGDLLTTSNTPGYAMKVADSAKAQGAILGKAMQSLEKGKKGQILVLVTLQ